MAYGENNAAAIVTAIVVAGAMVAAALAFSAKPVGQPTNTVIKEPASINVDVKVPDANVSEPWANVNVKSELPEINVNK